jgi:hypothetical protein
VSDDETADVVLDVGQPLMLAIEYVDALHAIAKAAKDVGHEGSGSHDACGRCSICDAVEAFERKWGAL